LISAKLGHGWVTDLDQLEGLKAHLDDTAFADQWMAVKKHNKRALAALVARECLVDFDANMMFDVQVKRIHEYKRQLLNILHVIHLYDRIDRGETSGFQPRCVLFGGKAAPGYFMAKLIVKLINNVVEIVNDDERARDWLRVAFLPDYRVTAMEVICPGTDLSEQISTAGKEASGTGNMKFMMNGAPTIGTLDGANIEIRDAVGEENFFLFGLTAEQVEVVKTEYDPDAIIKADADLARVMNLLEQGRFNRAEPGIFDPVVAAIRSANDPWLTAADFRSYVNAQRQASDAYRNRALWARMSILNTACSGRFSSDRTIGEYRDQIWYHPGSGAGE
jgi:starch phosphorylase